MVAYTAIVKTAKGKGNVELRKIQEPMPKPNEVKIEVKAAGNSFIIVSQARNQCLSIKFECGNIIFEWTEVVPACRFSPKRKIR